jgi:DnaJ-class molecular chaperone
MFSKMSDVYISDTSVEMNLRALLGISQNRDIKEAWTQWAKTNHPDKGGSVEKFVLVKAAYEEWQNATSQR